MKVYIEMQKTRRFKRILKENNNIEGLVILDFETSCKARTMFCLQTMRMDRIVFKA